MYNRDFPPITTTVYEFGSELDVTVTSWGKDIKDWIYHYAREDPRPDGDGFLLGLDIEWTPNSGRGQDNPVATLQLSTSSHCLIVQLLYTDYIPRQLEVLLDKPDLYFSGCGIKADARKLEDHHRLIYDVNQLLELDRVAANEGYTAKGLKNLCYDVLGYSLPKRRNITLSDWGASDLSDGQIEYAALDSWASFNIACRLLNNNRCNNNNYDDSSDDDWY